MPNRKRSPPATRRRALEMLAGSRDGVPEALMLAHGFSIELLVKLVHAGLATASAERTVAGAHVAYSASSTRATQDSVKVLLREIFKLNWGDHARV
jgi:hypothetical protein